MLEMCVTLEDDSVSTTAENTLSAGIMTHILAREKDRVAEDKHFLHVILCYTLVEKMDVLVKAMVWLL